jgi:serine protease Do
MKLHCLFFAAICFPGAVLAQAVDIPLLRPDERRVVDEQAAEFNDAISPVLEKAARSTVRVWAGSRRLAYGTVIGDGTQILTKWSEVMRSHPDLTVEAAGPEVRKAAVTGVYADEDLAVLTIRDGEPLAPVEWSYEVPELGRFLAAPQPDGRPAAFGVVSVLERNLRRSDQAFLGIEVERDFTGPGVRVRAVTPETGAAVAGLREGDVIREVGGRLISGLLELQNVLRGTSPGSSIRVLAESNGEEKAYEVTLGSMEDRAIPHFPGQRLQQMERMGGAISEVRDSFSRVVQTDMRPKPNQVGGPVVDLQGRVLGVTMARADRTRSFMMPALAITELLQQEAADPVAALRDAGTADQALARPRMVRPGGVPDPRSAPPRSAPRNEERMRRHLSDLERLMGRINEEIDELEGGR